MTSQLEREENELEAQYNNGEITLTEYNRAMQELHRDYRDAANQAADEAADRAREDELARW